MLQQISRSRNRKNKLQAKQKENNGSNSRSISKNSNNENQSNESPSNSQVKTQTTTHETAKNQQKVTRDNVFDYAIAAINKMGNADLLKFQEPEYNGSEWTINANNKSDAEANTIVVKDDGTV
ncbi:hypothetical protein [Staphylococcus warneri]|uniref:hypothetical protein n=1 Tax=Staphylococcus warneri TaxID=1292 RepID=UPI000CD0DEEB|nr:hypothetical protein [Staphylococcus warneri]MCC8990960.1 hypothetical protein [Staphylococcus sp.]MBP3032674.1 hypothetical protein [Staphylococcus warneri]MCM3070514.1 hypothetical protein [Staphylococcus warneri]MCR1796502.1 hypothetical protein [Staphylococcus warneri]MCT2596486.1 hypothetical protein [Staphylococcus warneri]